MSCRVRVEKAMFHWIAIPEKGELEMKDDSKNGKSGKCPPLL